MLAEEGEVGCDLGAGTEGYELLRLRVGGQEHPRSEQRSYVEMQYSIMELHPRGKILTCGIPEGGQLPSVDYCSHCPRRFAKDESGPR